LDSESAFGTAAGALGTAGEGHDLDSEAYFVGMTSPETAVAVADSSVLANNHCMDI